MKVFPQRTLDAPEVRRHIAEMQAAGTERQAQVSMARLALQLGKLTPAARQAYEDLLKELERYIS